MAPDAEAGKSLNPRPDPFAPLTSQLLPVGDGHEIYVESVGRADGIPAVYLHGGPGSGCQSDHRRLFESRPNHEEQPCKKWTLTFLGCNSLIPFKNSLILKLFSLIICLGNCSRSGCSAAVSWH
jgi:hypothetical protein